MTHQSEEPVSQPTATLRERAEAVLRTTRLDLAGMPPAEIESLVHGLQLRRIELELQHADLLQVQDELVVTQHQLRDREANLRQALAAAKAGNWRVNLATGEFSASDGALELHGLPPGTPMTHERALACVHPDDRGAVEAALQRTVEAGEPFQLELRVPLADGSTRWMASRAECLLEGGQACVVGIVQDITQRKEAEQTLCRLNAELEQRVAERTAELRNSESLLQKQFLELEHIYRTAPVGLGYLDRELRFVRVNDQLAAMNGKSAAEHAGRNPAEIVPEIAAGVQSLMRQVLDTGQPVLDLEIHGMTSADPGVPHHWLANYYPLQSEDGEVQGLSVVVADVTERKATEAALRESEERFRVLFDYNPAGVLVAEIGTRQFLFGNREFARMLGYTVEELPQLSVPDLHPPEAMPLVEEHFERMAQGSREPAFALPMRRRDGSVFLANIRAGHVMLGARPCLMGIFEDITARKRLEEERAEALRSLAVVEVRERQRISRELHDQTAQRLVALAVELKSLETNLNAGRSQTTRVTALRKAVDELQQQVRQIAWELRVGELLKGDLREALQEYVEDWSERAQVPVDYACREGDEEGLPAAIKATLYRVAQEALANIDKHAHARRASVLLERDAALVRLTIEDDGCGFDVEAVQHSPEAAQRLGLLGMQERVALVGGGLVIESSPGSGTTILVRIPVLPPVTCSTPTASP